ncbi:PBP1b-binding outer membrane lipoprotein LpoB [Bacillus tianshenii]|uniref:PBP1b-binding outer membrane lipoprotein LpoB n=1 Tax=Sutcliffiella tianshenii TaxID=1463404 RepID=A0ABS2NUT3_9BACI|nr:BsuPI-related putative proteinase inhibitor [Bacillus tianshenii]MBM7618411.1 PBP1b-binding outer membrane lipoprotein LpoB [Bacillus tianshenii]
MKRIALLLTMSFVLAACGTTQENYKATDAPEETTKDSNGSNVDNTAGSGDGEKGLKKPEKSKEVTSEDPNKQELSSTLEQKDNSFVFTVKNDTGKDAGITFSSGQEYDYMVYDASGKLVKKLSEGMMYTQAIKEDVLAPGEDITYSASYQEVTSGLDKGEYTIEFVFTEQNFQASAKEAFKVE